MKKEKLIKKILDKKADENNIIDLNAYGIGLEDMYEALNLDDVVGKSEQLSCHTCIDFKNLTGSQKCWKCYEYNQHRAR